MRRTVANTREQMRMTGRITTARHASSTAAQEEPFEPKFAWRRSPRRMLNEHKRYRIAVTAFHSPRGLWAALDDLATEGFTGHQLSILTSEQARNRTDLDPVPFEFLPDHLEYFEAELEDGAIVLVVSSATDDQQAKASKILLKHSKSRIKVCEFTRASEA